MSLSLKDCGAVILAGGGSRRMGSAKALLTIDGQTMLERTLAQLTDFEEILISANDPALCPDLPTVGDRFSDAGPLAGLHAALCAAKSPALFCVPCDLPNFSPELPRLLLSRMPETAEICISADSTGRAHPLCGIFRRSILPRLETYLDQGGRRVMGFIEECSSLCISTAGLLPDEIFFNMNTPLEFRAAAEKLSHSHQA